MDERTTLKWLVPYLITQVDLMLYIEPNFEEMVLQQLTDMLKLMHLQFEQDEIVAAIEEFHLENPTCPKRQGGTTKPESFKVLQDKIAYLDGIVQPEQRTPEWYAFRHRFLTASNIWKVFGTPSSRNQLIYDKCKPFLAAEGSSGNNVNTDSPMHWGQKYEAVSVLLYEQKYDTTVGEYGCLPHAAISFLAASPDGVNIKPTSEIYGRMLEVKNIVNREITGYPKMEYWIQMQLQLEVCNLDDCDFLETRFKEYTETEDVAMGAGAEASFLKDSNNEDESYAFTNTGKPKGVILQFLKDGRPLYIHKPLSIVTKEEYLKWEEETMSSSSCKDLTWIKNIYWYLDEWSCVFVKRNPVWFNHVLPMLQEFWSIIEDERVNGYAHRAPKKRKAAAEVVGGVGEMELADKSITPICLIQSANQDDEQLDD